MAPARAAIPELGLHLAPCTQGRAKAPAQCGTFGVYENRKASSGRIISLGVILLKAKHPSHRAIAEIAGGPGEAATPFAQFILDGAFAGHVLALRDRYDVLFVDDRGMGESHPFGCNFTPLRDPGSYFAQLWPERLLSACRTKSAATHDLGQYNTNNAVDDLNDVRAALGYPKLVLDSGSYGTFFSLVYIRRHPDHVESAILDGVDAPHFQPFPGSPDGAQIALDHLIASCSRAVECRSRFPHFADHFMAVVRRLDSGTLPVRVKNPITKRVETVALSKEVFADQIRHALYDPFASKFVPYVTERAYQRDYVPLGQVIQVVSQGFSEGVDSAANLSYTCADSMPFIDWHALNAAAAHSFTSDARVRAQRHACGVWNVPPMPLGFNDPVRSNAPILMISASDDPGTPPRYGEEAMRYLPNAKEILVSGGGHAVETPCSERLIVQFVRAGSAKALDVSQCSVEYKQPKFASSMKGWPQL